MSTLNKWITARSDTDVVMSENLGLAQHNDRLRHENKPFAHDCCNGDFLLIPDGDELIVFGLHIRSVPDRDQRKQEDSVSQIWAAVLNACLPV